MSLTHFFHIVYTSIEPQNEQKTNDSELEFFKIRKITKQCVQLRETNEPDMKRTIAFEISIGLLLHNERYIYVYIMIMQSSNSNQHTDMVRKQRPSDVRSKDTDNYSKMYSLSTTCTDYQFQYNSVRNDSISDKSE